MKRKLVAIFFLCSIGNAHAMEQQQAMLERVMVLAEAATRAAIGAEKATTQTVHTAADLASSSSSSVSDGLQAVSRILKNLEDAMAFASWRFQFMSWLTYGDSRCIQVLQAKEATEATPTMADYNEAQKEMSHKLYAVLTSYLRGRCAHLAEAHAKARDGFRSLVQFDERVWAKLSSTQSCVGTSPCFLSHILQRPQLHGLQSDLRRDNPTVWGVQQYQVPR